MSQALTAADSATHSTASDGRSSGGLRLLLSNEFGLAVLIAVTLLVFSLTLDGFTVDSTLEF